MKSFFQKMKLKRKLVFLILLVTTVIASGVIGYLAVTNRNNDINNAKSILESSSMNHAQTFSEYLNYSMNITRSLAKTSLAMIEADMAERFLLDKILEKTLIENPQFLAVWTRWEPDGFDGIDSVFAGSEIGTQSGVFDLNYYYTSGNIVRYVDMTTPPEAEEGIVYGPYIAIPKETLQEAVIEPYYYSFTGEPEDNLLMTTTSVPVVVENEYKGVLAIDIELESLYDVISKMEFYESGFCKLISHNEMVNSHPNTTLIGATSYEFAYYDQEAINTIQSGEQKTIINYSNDLNTDVLKIFIPIIVGNTPTPWSFIAEIPISEIKAPANRQLFIGLLLGLIALLILFFVITQIANYISNPVHKTTQVLKVLSEGDLDNTPELKAGRGGDELVEMANATNTLVKGLRDTVNFARNIEQGNLDTEYSLLSDKDQLGHALLKMRESLVLAEDEEKKRKEEDVKRNWATEGYAKFGEILRIDNNDMSAVALKIVQNLVEYIGAIQGGLFVLNDKDENNKFLEMAACFAYDRQKFLDKSIKIGEGLVGSCFKEGKTIYMTDIPDSYIKITSGLGNEIANALLIVPLKLNDDIYGIIEIASFNKLEKHHIEFVEKVAESVASTISNIKINLRTSELLEQSQKQAEEMRAQEEEMRQNMEELAATQEEMARKTTESESILNALNEASFTLEYNTEGYIQNISDSYCNFLGIPREDCIGKHHSYKVDFTEEQKKEYQKFWNDLKAGKIRKQEIRVNVDGNTFDLVETYAPIIDNEGNVTKIFKIANDITESKRIVADSENKYNDVLKKLNDCMQEKQALLTKMKKIK